MDYKYIRGPFFVFIDCLGDYKLLGGISTEEEYTLKIMRWDLIGVEDLKFDDQMLDCCLDGDVALRD